MPKGFFERLAQNIGFFERCEAPDKPRFSMLKVADWILDLLSSEYHTTRSKGFRQIQKDQERQQRVEINKFVGQTVLTHIYEKLHTGEKVTDEYWSLFIELDPLSKKYAASTIEPEKIDEINKRIYHPVVSEDGGAHLERRIKLDGVDSVVRLEKPQQAEIPSDQS